MSAQNYKNHKQPSISLHLSRICSNQMQKKEGSTCDKGGPNTKSVFYKKNFNVLVFFKHNNTSNLVIFSGSKTALKQDDKSSGLRGSSWSRILVLGRVCRN